jgi:hypothetical protein
MQEATSPTILLITAVLQNPAPRKARRGSQGTRLENSRRGYKPRWREKPTTIKFIPSAMYMRTLRDFTQDAAGEERGDDPLGVDRCRTGRERIDRHISKRAETKLTFDSESSSEGIWVDSR